MQEDQDSYVPAEEVEEEQDEEREEEYQDPDEEGRAGRHHGGLGLADRDDESQEGAAEG